MKNILLFILLPFLMFAQNTQKFTYNVQAIEDKNSKIDEMIVNMSPNYKELINQIEFNLIVDKNSSCFSMDYKTKPDDFGVDMFLAFVNTNKKIIQKNDSIYKTYDIEISNKKYIVKDTIQNNWTLHNESKIIMGYKCYKATCLNIVINEKVKFTNDIIAWYCPIFQNQFGPLSYGKLPGLIFELQTRKALLGLTKIEFETYEEICELDKKIKVITSSQLDEEIKFHMAEMKKMN